MFMVLTVARPIPTAMPPTPMALMAARLTTIMVQILPTLVALKVAQLTLMMGREQHTERMEAQLPGVMVVAPLIAPMVVQLPGVMVPDLPKVRVVVQLVGVTVPELRHQRVEKPEAGAGKRFMVGEKIFADFSSFPVLHFKPNEQ